MHGGRRHASAFTLVEIMLAAGLLAFATAGIIACFVAALKVYSSTKARQALAGEASLALTVMGDDVRFASGVGVPAGGYALEFTTSRYDGADRPYRYMLYSAANPPPNPPFTAESYSLIMVPVPTPSVPPDYSAARVIARNVGPPTPATPIFSLMSTPTPPPPPTPSRAPGPPLVGVQMTFAGDGESYTIRTDMGPRN
ncbi:MAG: hypothetical protein WCP22_03780 [Chlamydiota bacterium]